MEKQQQIKGSLLKPCNESQLEHTISYEQLAVDLTAELAKRESDCYVKKALDFALLEDFDHLYRYSDLLEMEQGVQAERLVGRYTEIMPARPTIAHHRFPKDNVRRCIDSKTADKQTVLNTMIITAAEQQTMNYYMNTAALWPEETGRRLYQEIGMIEEQHVSHYGSLLNPCATPLENLLIHQYTECWLYWSCYETETDPGIREIWRMLFEQEIMHLNVAQKLLEDYEKKEAGNVIPNPVFPEPLKLESNIEYVRDVLANTVNNTAMREGYVNVEKCPETFIDYQTRVNSPLDKVITHSFIQDYMNEKGQDYRFETAPNPIEALRDRKSDNVCVGRHPLCNR